jgi:hypothetical protein
MCDRLHSCGTALDLHQTFPVTSVDQFPTEPNLSVAYFATIAVLTLIRHHRYLAVIRHVEMKLRSSNAASKVGSRPNG